MKCFRVLETSFDKDTTYQGMGIGTIKIKRAKMQVKTIKQKRKTQPGGSSIEY